MSIDESSAYWRLPELFPDLGRETLLSLKIYKDELARFNNALNLISPKTMGSADVLHFADSILASRIIVRDATDIKEFYDIGSGGGFPGMVMGILFPKVSIKLLEVDTRKSEFLKHIASLLKLQNITVLNQSLETVGENSIQCAISRAFSPLTNALLQSRKQIKAGGVYYHLKSQKWPSEISQLPTQLCSIWQPSLVSEYKLPFSLGKFAVVKTNKIS
jgi:16S rRNA (guanine527-N7)-methyltransferase